MRSETPALTGWATLVFLCRAVCPVCPVCTFNILQGRERERGEASAGMALDAKGLVSELGSVQLY